MAAEQPTPEWLYHFLPGDRPELSTDPDAWTEQDDQVGAAHFAYLQQAAADGVLILAGRSQDGIGPAVVIFEAGDEAAARAFMENDPFVSSGLFGASLHPFRAALMRD
jgi:uncharacterized protein YciI